jgi:hypothetical protein
MSLTLTREDHKLLMLSINNLMVLSFGPRWRPTTSQHSISLAHHFHKQVKHELKVDKLTSASTNQHPRHLNQIPRNDIRPY